MFAMRRCQKLQVRHNNCSVWIKTAISVVWPHRLVVTAFIGINVLFRRIRPRERAPSGRLYLYGTLTSQAFITLEDAREISS